MSCCGQKRAIFKRQNTHTTARVGIQGPTSLPVPKEDRTANFRYDGRSFLRVKGAITNTTYSFRFPGAIVAVDLRDLPSLMAEPELEKVPNDVHPK